MRCPRCRREIPEGEGVRFCPSCGASQGTGAALQAQGAGPQTTGIAPEGQSEAPRKSSDITILEPPTRPTPPWAPSSALARQWVQGQVDLDEVLGVREDTPWAVIQERWQKLRDVAGNWERNPVDADLQRLGQQVLKKIPELRDLLADEAGFRAFLRGQRQKRLAEKYRQRLEEATRQDRALQVEEWKVLVNLAQQDGYAPEDLTLLVRSWAEAHPDVLVGVPAGDWLLMTPEEVRDLWDREGPAGLAQVDPKRMARWIRACLGDEEKAQWWEQGEPDRVLWSWGSRVCWLEGHRLESLKAWVEGVYRGDLEAATLQQMGRVADWLEKVHLQKDAADRLRQAQSQPMGERRRVLRTVLEEVFWKMDDRPDPEVAYGGTRRWVEEDPEFEEGLYGHVIHCAQTGRDDEGVTCLQALLEKTAGKEDVFFDYRVRLRRNLPDLSPRFWSRAEEVIRGYESRLVGLPFKFREGQARDLLELVQLCDRFSEEAANYLTQGRFERWLDARGEAYLADMCRKIVNTYQHRPERALEMFVRELYRSLGRQSEGLPQLRVEPMKVEWKSLPVGSVARAQVRLVREGRGHAWGKVRVEGVVRNLSWTSTFDAVPATIDVRLNTSRYAPGTYTVTLVVEPEGLPPLQIPLQWEVTPLEVVLTPGCLAFGRVTGGSVTAEVRLECRTPGGRLIVDRVTPDPPVPGLEVETQGEATAPVVKVRWNVEDLEAGCLHQTCLRIETNVGSWNVPVSASRSIPWGRIWTRALTLGTLIGGGLVGLRFLVFPQVWAWTLLSFLLSVKNAQTFLSENEKVWAFFGVYGLGVLFSVVIGYFYPKMKRISLLFVFCISGCVGWEVGIIVILAGDFWAKPIIWLGLPPAVGWGVAGFLGGTTLIAIRELRKVGDNMRWKAMLAFALSAWLPLAILSPWEPPGPLARLPQAPAPQVAQSPRPSALAPPTETKSPVPSTATDSSAAPPPSAEAGYALTEETDRSPSASTFPLNYNEIVKPIKFTDKSTWIVAVDDILSTAWCAEPSGDGLGEWLKITFSSVRKVTKIGVIPGYAKYHPKYGDLFWLNNRIKDVYFTFSDGSSLRWTFADERQWQFVENPSQKSLTPGRKKLWIEALALPSPPGGGF